jgi:hypothetical protein
MMKYVDPSNSPALPKQQLEINPNHPLIVKLYNSISSKPRLSTMIAEQVNLNPFVKITDVSLRFMIMLLLLQASLMTLE